MRACDQSCIISGDLLEATDARYNDIGHGSLLQCDVWDIWRPLVVAARNGEYQKYIVGVQCCEVGI